MVKTHIRTQTGRGGFTLLELLAVMAIMALLSTLAVTSYFSAVRGMARRSASEHFLNALTQARQRACIDGAHVSLIVFNQPAGYDNSGDLNQVLPSYVICRELGRVTFVQGNFLFDQFSDLKQLFGVEGDNAAGEYSTSYKSALRLYNLSKGFWVKVNSRVTPRKSFGSSQDLLATATGKIEWDEHRFEDYAFEMFTGNGAKSQGATTWQVGDSYGIEVSSILNLPKTFYFEGLGWDGISKPTSHSLETINYVTFGPDGRSVNKDGSPRSASFDIRSTDTQAGRMTFRVDGNGTFSMEGTTP